MFAACSRLPAGLQPFLASRGRQRRSQLHRAGAGDGNGAATDGGSGCGASGYAAQQQGPVPSNELPPELQDLCISEDGQYLIDSTTGKAVNEFGATRFDVAVRAMRGEFDPPAYVPNTERSSGLLLDSLTQFPAVYDFQLVVRPGGSSSGGSSRRSSSAVSSSSGGGSDVETNSSQQQQQQEQQEQQDSPAEEILERYRQLIADTTAADIPRHACTIKPRLGGKYWSLSIPARVQAAHVVELVWAALADDPEVVMKY